MFLLESFSESPILTVSDLSGALMAAMGGALTQSSWSLSLDKTQRLATNLPFSKTQTDFNVLCFKAASNCLKRAALYHKHNLVICQGYVRKTTRSS